MMDSCLMLVLLCRGQDSSASESSESSESESSEYDDSEDSEDSDLGEFYVDEDEDKDEDEYKDKDKDKDESNIKPNKDATVSNPEIEVQLSLI